MTRLKTIEFVVPGPTTVVDNTLTELTTITAYIPEFSGSVTIKKAWVEVNIFEGATQAVGNYTSRRIDVSVGGAGATSYTNSNLMTGSGENQSVFWNADCTAHFTTNWTTGTSKTVAISILIDGTGATLAWTDPQTILYITYEYDDTQATQIKTVWLPLNCPVGVMQTSASTAEDTIPALDTELPETSKTFRSIGVVLQGMQTQQVGTTDTSISLQIGTYTAYTTQVAEHGNASDHWYRVAWPAIYMDSSGTEAGVYIDRSVAKDFNVWMSQAKGHHAQAWLIVTYEFSASGTTGCYNSVLLPAGFSGIMGGTASTDFQRLRAELWIEEPATVTSKRIAFYASWEAAAAISTLNFRVGTGSFVAYTDVAAMVCGSNSAMIRNDAAFTLARGRNVLTVDAYRSDTADFGWGLCGFFIATYVSAKPANGYGAANHTVKYPVISLAAATATNLKSSATAINLPETAYFINAIGGHVGFWPDSTGIFNGGALLVERTNGAGDWITAISTPGHTDAEQGLHEQFYQCRECFYRWAGDTASYDPDGAARVDPEASRRYWWSYAAASTGFVFSEVWMTYHGNTFTSSGAVTGYADADGAGLTVELFRSDDGTKLASATTTAGGNYSLTHYDNTVQVFAACYEDATHVGRTVPFTLGT